MPLYTYICSQCEHKMDLLQKYEEGSIECKYCAPFEMDRMIGTPAIKLTGSGFHDNDYTRLGPKRKG
jgi:putative FmdB family regulatory protein